jgi:CheY-like chemotaxis protein
MPVCVLVVDDSAAFRRSAVRLLTLRGYAVLPPAVDRAAALDVVATHGCPHGALVDVHLPGDDGLAVAAALRRVCRSVRVVLTSSDVDRVSDADLARCGAVAFVVKDELAVVDLDALLGGEVGEQKASTP